MLMNQELSDSLLGECLLTLQCGGGAGAIRLAYLPCLGDTDKLWYFVDCEDSVFHQCKRREFLLMPYRSLW